MQNSFIAESPFLQYNHAATTCKKIHNICDIICENLPYGGTNCVILDQLILHICDSYGLNCSGIEKMFSVAAHERQI